MKEQIKPGLFGKQVAADYSRRYLDVRNEQYLYLDKRADWVFYGDSITAYWDVKIYFETENGLVIKRGIGGDTTEFANKRYIADVVQLKPKNVVILIGVNDLMTIFPDLWWKTPGADCDTVINSIKENIEDMIKKSEGIKLHLCSILPTLLCPPYDRKLMDEAINKANTEIKLLCKKYNVKYVDYYSEMYDENIGGLPENLSYDGVHPNATGYMKMAEILKRETDLK